MIKSCGRAEHVNVARILSIGQLACGRLCVAMRLASCLATSSSDIVVLLCVCLSRI